MADTQAEAVALLDVGVRFLEGTIAHFAQVQQAFHAVVQRDERAEVDHIGNRAFDQLAFVVTLGRVGPRVVQQPLAAEGDTVGLAVQAEHVNVDLFADAQDVTRVVDAMPGQLADVDEAVGPAQVDERAEVAQAGDGATDNVAFLQLGQQAGLLLGAPFTLRLALAEDQAATRLIDFDDLHGQLFADQIVPGIATAAHTGRHEMRARDEAFETVPAHQNTAAVVAGHIDFDHIFAFEQRAGLFPVVLLQAHVDRDDQVIVLVTRVQHVNGHFRADTQARTNFRIEPVEVLHRYDAVAFRAHVDDHFALVNLQNDRVADLTTLRRLIGEIRRIQQGEKLGLELLCLIDVALRNTHGLLPPYESLDTTRPITRRKR